MKLNLYERKALPCLIIFRARLTQIRSGRLTSVRLERANLNLIALNESLLYRCEPTSVELQRLLPAVVYARFLPGQVLDSDQVLAIRDQVKQVDSQATVVFAITDQRVDDDGWAQIGTRSFRWRWSIYKRLVVVA